MDNNGSIEIYKLPAYVGSDVPKEAWIPVEMFNPDNSTTYIPPENLEKQKVGWSIVEPDAGDVQEVLTFWGKDMAQLFKYFTPRYKKAWRPVRCSLHNLRP